MENVEAEPQPFGDRITLDNGTSIYLPPKPSPIASRWARALREASPDQLERIVQALIDNQCARMLRLVEESLDVDR